MAEHLAVAEVTGVRFPSLTQNVVIIKINTKIMHQIIIYTTPTCVYCKMTKEFFGQNNIQYQEVDVSTDQKAQEEMIKKSGQMGVPVVDVDGQIIVGFDKEKLSELLGVK